MKTSNDPRHQKRQHIVQLLFAQSFPHDQAQDEVIKPIMIKLPEIDTYIETIAPEFPIDKINKVDLAILRLSTYEILFEKEAPEKVYIDEAIELAKEFGGESSPAFINGALGKLVKDLPSDKSVVRS